MARQKKVGGDGKSLPRAKSQILESFQEDVLKHYETVKRRRQTLAKKEEAFKKAKSARDDAASSLEKARLQLEECIAWEKGDHLFRREDQPNGETWETMALRDVLAGRNVPEKIIEKLEVDIATLGQLADFTATCRLTDIRGIGHVAAERIERALESYWAEHPEHGQAAAAAS